MKKKRSVSRNIILIAIFAIIFGGITFGYAQLRETLTINGKAKLDGVKWDVGIKNLQLNNDNIGVDGEPTFVIDSSNVAEIIKNTTVMEELSYSTDSEDNPIVEVVKNDATGGTKIHFSVTLKEPNQKFSFKVEITNSGTLDAKLVGIKEKNGGEEDFHNVTHLASSYEHFVSDEATEPHFRYLVSGMPSLDAVNTIVLKKGAKRTVTFTFEYPTLTDDSNAPTEDYTFEKTIELLYDKN